MKRSKNTSKTRIVYRSAITGRIVTSRQARRSPSTTVRHVYKAKG